MFKELAEVIRFRELLWNLVVRDLRVRYKNSVLGFFWSLIIPLVQVATMTAVFKFIMQISPGNYSAYLLCTFIPFSFFQLSIVESTTAILAQRALVKKTYFPREILPISIILANTIHFVLALLVFFVYLLILGTPILVTWLLLPVVVLINVFLNMGIAFFLCALNTFYEDIKYIATVVINLLFYAFPVIYMVEQVMDAQSVPAKLKGLAYAHFFYNPISYLLISYRKLLLPPFLGKINGKVPVNIPFSYSLLGLAAVTSLVIFFAGYAYFNKRKWQFAERL